MTQRLNDLLCSGNGLAFHNKSHGICTCHHCYEGRRCAEVVASECHGTIHEQHQPYNKIVKKCKCPFNRTGPCCEQKKCAGSNPIPNPETGRCECSDPDLRSGEFCEKVKCKNGITAVKNGYCDCGGIYLTGEFCENNRCLNGGRPYLNNSKCHCKTRFTGSNCQYVICDHGGKQSLYGYKCVDCTFLYTGDYCQEIHRLNMAMLLIPAGVLMIILLLLARAFFSEKDYTAASANDRYTLQPISASFAGRANRGESSFVNPAEPNRPNAEYNNRQYRRELDLGSASTSSLANGYGIYAPDNLERLDSSDTNQIENNPNYNLDRPPSYVNPPPYEEVVKNLPNMNNNI